MQITKAMELVASSKLRRAKERVENSRPYFETLYATLFDIAAADSEFSSPYLAKCEKKCCLYIVIAGDRGLAGGYNSNILKAVEADAEGREYCVLPIGKKAVEYFERHKIRILTDSFRQKCVRKTLQYTKYSGGFPPFSDANPLVRLSRQIMRYFGQRLL